MMNTRIPYSVKSFDWRRIARRISVVLSVESVEVPNVVYQVRTVCTYILYGMQ